MKLTDDLYYRKLENTSTTDLVDMIREKDKCITDLEAKLENIRHYLDNEIPHELINEATTIIYKMV